MFKKGGGNARRWGFLWALGFKPRLTSWPRPVVQLLSSVWQTPHIFLTFFKTLQGPSHIFQHCFKTFQDPPHIFQHCFKTPQDLSHILHFSTLFQGVALHASRLPELREENPKTSPENLINTFCLQIGPEAERIR